MLGAPAKVRYCQDGPTLTFHVAGRATMTQALPLRRRAEHALESGTALLRVDLRDCTYMDSTFVGTLLALNKVTGAGGGARMVVLAPSAPCLRILDDLGLGDVLTRTDGDLDAGAAWVELDCGTDDANAFKRNIKQAHEHLAALPGPVGRQFEQVVECLNQADRASPPAPKAPGE